MTRWFEDINVGEEFELGSHTFTAEEIISFGRQYDPQYFHLSADDGAKSHFGGLIASGWHTACVGHRKLVDALDAEADRIKARGQQPGVSGPSPGVNEMVFKVPVRPGDTVHYTLTTTSKRPSKSLPGWGLLINETKAVNQRGEQVYRMEAAGFSKLRDFKPSLKLRLAIWVATVPGLNRLVKRG